MNITLTKSTLINTDADVIIVELFDGEKKLSAFDSALDKKLDGFISNLIYKKKDFTPEFLKTYSFPTFGKIKAANVILLGLGKQKELTLDKYRQALMSVIPKINCYQTAAISLCDEHPEDATLLIAETASLASYDFDKYKSTKSKNKLKDIVITDVQDKYLKTLKPIIERGQINAEATNFARNLINEPAQYATPAKLAEIAKSFKNLTVKVYDKKECEEMGMGAFLAVGRASANPPKFIHLKYTPKTIKKNIKKIAIIGKGLTFDSGGMDIKPPSSMLNMKDDMSGAAAVLGMMSVIHKIAPNVEVNGIIAACENLVSGTAYKPGDILTAKNKKTIEVDNTDAEGRLTLADALCYAEELKVDEIIDLATLTGACAVALGHFASGIMGNNQELIEGIISSSQKTGELYWQLPLLQEHMESLKSDIADMKNTGSRYAGACVAGAFLKNYVKNTNWAHIDIAGTAYLDKPYKGFIKGATGVGVRTLLTYLSTK